MADKVKAAVMFYGIEDTETPSGLFVAVGRFRDGTVLRTEATLSYKAASIALGERLDAMVRNIPSAQQEAFCKDKLWTDDTPEARAAGAGLWSLGVSYEVVEKPQVVPYESERMSVTEVLGMDLITAINVQLLHACGLKLAVGSNADGTLSLHFERMTAPAGGYKYSHISAISVYVASARLHALRCVNAAARKLLGGCRDDGVQHFEYPSAMDILKTSRMVDKWVLDMYPSLKEETEDKEKDGKAEEEDPPVGR